MSVRTVLASTLAALLGVSLLGSTLPATASTPAAAAVTAAAPSAVMPRAAAWGTPPINYKPPAGSLFAFPNRSQAEKYAIRNRVLFTVRSTWGGYRDRNRLPVNGNGSIRIATWSFNDMAIAKALVAAHNRGVSVQVLAAKARNEDNDTWKYLKRNLGTAYYKAGVAGSSDRVSFARECAGSCRGYGGTPHSKYFLFDNVGSQHLRHIVFSTSMNLTSLGYNGQWNQAQVSYSQPHYNAFLQIFRESRPATYVSSPYRSSSSGVITDLFFPLYGANSSNDPVMRLLNQVRCAGATSGGNSAGRTRIRVIQYAIYGDRGLWIAKKLRGLWNAGCDIQIIYALSTRPVLGVLRSTAGRGAIPMKQSVILNKRKEIVKYNHSKWVTVTGSVGSSTGAWWTQAGSGNWSEAAFVNDEQFQQILSYNTANAHMRNFVTTWQQKSSRTPSLKTSGAGEARMLPASNSIPFGTGAFKYLTPEG